MAIDEALRCKEANESKTILFGLSGHGHFDLAAYMDYKENKMMDYVPTDQELQAGFDTLPDIS